MKTLGRIGSTVCVLIFFLAMVLLLSYAWVASMFKNATLDVIVIQLSLPLTGMDPRYYYYAGVVVLAVVLFTFLYARFLWRVSTTPTFWGIRSGVVMAAARCLAPFLLMGSLVLLERKYELVEFLFPGEPYSTYVEDNYYMPTPDEFTFPGGKNNLVVLILESMEWTFDDPRLFKPSLIPRLSEMRKTDSGFMGHRQCTGTEYSIAGFISILMGMPSEAGLTARNMVDLFLGKSEPEESLNPSDPPGDFRDYSVMGILDRHGYRVSFFCAADARFNDFGGLMERSTKSCDIRDFVYYSRTRPEVTKKQNAWGLLDGYLYDRAREYLTELEADGPFMMVVETVDTHPPGHVEENLPKPYGDFRDAYVQADILATDFISWIQEQPFGPKTTIVVVGDHLLGEAGMASMKNLPPIDTRSIMALVVNSRVEAASDLRERTFASWDLAPTILEATGAVFPERRFALGTSLFSPQLNLLERDGFSKCSKALKKHSRLRKTRYRQ